MVILSLKWSRKDEAKVDGLVESVEGKVVGAWRESRELRHDHSFFG